MRVHHCPRCELRFAAEPEVRQHLITDHGVEPEALEHHVSGLIAGVRPHRDPPDPEHQLRTG